jgi:nitrile hydratase
MSNHHHPRAMSETEHKVQALETVLLQKGLITMEELDKLIDLFENQIGPLNGARLAARAWTDPAFKTRLLQDGSAAIAEFGIINPQEIKFIVVENSAQVHNVIVCTLCSCYPWNVLGLPPTWYKSNAYRSRVVSEPREVLGEFGLELEEDVIIHVWDSLSETRYMVLPERPEGTEHLSEEELVKLITRDALVGVAKATLTP